MVMCLPHSLVSRFQGNKGSATAEVAVLMPVFAAMFGLLAATGAVQAHQLKNLQIAEILVRQQSLPQANLEEFAKAMGVEYQVEMPTSNMRCIKVSTTNKNELLAEFENAQSFCTPVIGQ